MFVQVPAIDHLEKSMFKQYQKYAEQFLKQRQQDVKDEASDALKSRLKFCLSKSHVHKTKLAHNIKKMFKNKPPFET